MAHKSYEIRCYDVLLKLLELTWAADNLANGLSSTNDFTEALKWCEIVRDYHLDGTDQEKNGSKESDPTLMINMVVNLFRSDQPEQAKTLLKTAIKQIEVKGSYDWCRASK